MAEPADQSEDFTHMPGRLGKAVRAHGASPAHSGRIPNDSLWAVHQQAKQALVDKVRELTGVVLNPDQPILGFVRRMTAYKRTDLMFGAPQRHRPGASLADRHGRQGPTQRTRRASSSSKRSPQRRT